MRLTILLALTLSASMVAAPVFAISPHFIGTSGIHKNLNGSIIAAFKAAELANLPVEYFLTSSGGSAVSNCASPGKESSASKQVSFGPLQGEKTFVQPHDSQITGIVTIGPPPFSTTSKICTAKVSLTYFNVILHVQQHGRDILTFSYGEIDT